MSVQRNGTLPTCIAHCDRHPHPVVFALAHGTVFSAISCSSDYGNEADGQSKVIQAQKGQRDDVQKTRTQPTDMSIKRDTQLLRYNICMGNACFKSPFSGNFVFACFIIDFLSIVQLREL